MHAVILAAGAARLRPDDTAPKALLEVGGVPVLRRAMTTLLRAGIDQFTIALGYQAAAIRAAVIAWFPDLEIAWVENTAYATTHNAQTLLLARAHVAGHSFVLLDDDVVFDLAVIEELVVRGPDAIAVRSVGEIGLEDVKVTADREDRVLAIGKHVPARSAMGESVGIALFSPKTSTKLFAALAKRAAHEYYEAAIQQIVDDGATLYGVDIGTKFAAEIDTPADLAAANAHLAHEPAFDVRVTELRLAI
ncbi:MAG TPA: NTP transferase domain-containing protein [Kofleriaceae bacterium]|jgi:choline kinase